MTDAALRVWAYICRKISGYYIRQAVEAEGAREFFRGTVYQWEVQQAWVAHKAALSRAFLWSRRGETCARLLRLRAS